MMGVTSSHKVEFPDGRIMWKCENCGGYYNNELQASRTGSSGDYSHQCRSKPK